jgi:hypothetical protein
MPLSKEANRLRMRRKRAQERAWKLAVQGLGAVVHATPAVPALRSQTFGAVVHAAPSPASSARQPTRGFDATSAWQIGSRPPPVPRRQVGTLDAQTPLRTLQDLDRLKWIAAEQEGRLRSLQARIEALEQRGAGGGFIAFLARLMERG